MPEDAFLARWSLLLYAFVALAAAFTFASPLYALTHECRMAVMKGEETWNIDLFSLSATDFTVIFALALGPRIIWLAALWEILTLARLYRRGHIFEERSAHSLVRFGAVLGVMGAANCICYPLGVHYVYWRGLSPWLGDITMIDVIQPDYLMAGLFFIIFGNVMRRAVEMEQNNRLII